MAEFEQQIWGSGDDHCAAANTSSLLNLFQLSSWAKWSYGLIN